MYNIYAYMSGQTYSFSIKGNVKASATVDALLDAGFEVESDLWGVYVGVYS